MWNGKEMCTSKTTLNKNEKEELFFQDHLWSHINEDYVVLHRTS
jgi:hypothetical protein